MWKRYHLWAAQEPIVARGLTALVAIAILVILIKVLDLDGLRLITMIVLAVLALAVLRVLNDHYRKTKIASASDYEGKEISSHTVLMRVVDHLVIEVTSTAFWGKENLVPFILPLLRWDDDQELNFFDTVFPLSADIGEVTVTIQIRLRAYVETQFSNQNLYDFVVRKDGIKSLRQWLTKKFQETAKRNPAVIEIFKRYDQRDFIIRFPEVLKVVGSEFLNWKNIIGIHHIEATCLADSQTWRVHVIYHR